VQEYANQDETVIYADPPYFEKAGSLYMNSFTLKDHADLAACLNEVALKNWVLTYDDVPQVAELYPERSRRHISLNYSAHRVMKAREIMVLSDSLTGPATLF
jgi:DNA adenine methylase